VAQVQLSLPLSVAVHVCLFTSVHAAQDAHDKDAHDVMGLQILGNPLPFSAFSRPIARSQSANDGNRGSSPAKCALHVHL
jgi:hypothetical protein